MNDKLVDKLQRDAGLTTMKIYCAPRWETNGLPYHSDKCPLYDKEKKHCVMTKCTRPALHCLCEPVLSKAMQMLDGKKDKSAKGL